MSTAVLNEKVEVFKKSITDIVELLNNTEESTLYVKPSETEWSAMQIVAHVLEAVDFWVEDLEALLIVPGAKWGRNHEHVRRLAAVEENKVGQLKKEDAIEALQNLVPRVEAALGKVKEADLEKTAPSYNPNFDGKPLSFLIDHLIVKHVVGHHDQIVRHLAKVK
ncbi:DinB family protein [Bacillus sp. B15-48]|uniref:DinB family protein n=1 Tax=Bacillus sp. B15-48 TaxID=1548601 RepID=UPI00193FC16D|nr:DinB family protein [Bacillus sp. B15-48]